MPKVCEGCGQEGASKCCSGCLEAFYCSTACQRQHWKAGHRNKCVKAEKPSAATAAAKAAAKAAKAVAKAAAKAAKEAAAEPATSAPREGKAKRRNKTGDQRKEERK